MQSSRQFIAAIHPRKSSRQARRTAPKPITASCSEASSNTGKPYRFRPPADAPRVLALSDTQAIADGVLEAAASVNAG
jgi:hypothetical protein